MKFVVQTLRL